MKIKISDMKKILKVTIGLFALLIVSCNDGIDPITAVDPGADQGAPSVTVMKPASDVIIDEFKIESSVDIEFAVEDDIEIDMITVDLDGSVLASYDSFTDYRIYGDAFTQDGIEFGDHVLTVKATDISGNTTTVTRNISKPPYTPLFANEVFYMPFDGNDTEFVSISNPTEVGTPGFGQGFIGSNSFRAGAAGSDSYISYPMGDMLGSSFTGMFWYRVNSSDTRAGIITLGDPTTAPGNRGRGFRLFREGGSSSQGIKLIVGAGDGAESWNTAASISVNGDWIHVAFTVSPTETVVYLNGSPASTATMAGPIDWTNCDDLVIGAGGPAFSYWNHLSDNSEMDELRFFNAALSQSEIQAIINETNAYEPMFDGEIVYMPFEGSFTDVVNNIEPTQVGTPTFAGQSHGGANAYAGVLESYLTYPLDNVLNTEFSATMWYKLHGVGDELPVANRAGILSIRRPMDGANHDLTHGFTFFRENAGDNQRFKLNVGTGGAGNWFDGGENADVPAGSTEWIHLAFTISGSNAAVYINGEVAKEGSLPGPIDWTDCNVFSIMSGAPNFLQWSHYSDLSYLDDLRIYNKSLSQAEVQATME